MYKFKLPLFILWCLDLPQFLFSLSEKCEMKKTYQGSLIQFNNINSRKPPIHDQTSLMLNNTTNSQQAKPHHGGPVCPESPNPDNQYTFTIAYGAGAILLTSHTKWKFMVLCSLLFDYFLRARITIYTITLQIWKADLMTEAKSGVWGKKLGILNDIVF